MSQIAPTPRTRVDLIPRRSFTLAQREMVLNRQGGCCADCGNPLLGSPWQIDHVIPLALGGLHEPDNWQGLCAAPCHARKTAKDITAIRKAQRLAIKNGPPEHRPQPTQKLRSRGFRRRWEGIA